MERTNNEDHQLLSDYSRVDAYLAALPRKVRVAHLFGVYGPLLNERRRNILSLWIDEDYSLGEIAEEECVSRQAVNDSIKKSEQILLESEKQLGVVRRMLVQEALMRACENAPDIMQTQKTRETFAAIRRLWEENPWPLKD